MGKSRGGGGATSSEEVGGAAAPGLGASCPTEGSNDAVAPTLPSAGGGKLLLSSLGALLTGVLLSLGGSGGGAALSEADEGSGRGGAADCWSERGSAGATSSGGAGHTHVYTLKGDP